MPKILWKTIRAGKYGGFDVHGFFKQPSGVLKGQTLKRFLDNYETVEEAWKEHPDVAFGSHWTDPTVSLNHLPDENTPVAGGMYPDDV